MMYSLQLTTDMRLLLVQLLTVIILMFFFFFYCLLMLPLSQIKLHTLFLIHNPCAPLKPPNHCIFLISIQNTHVFINDLLLYNPSKATHDKNTSIDQMTKLQTYPMWSGPIIGKQFRDFIDSKIAWQQTDVPVQDVTKHLNENMHVSKYKSIYLLTYALNYLLTYITDTSLCSAVEDQSKAGVNKLL